MDSYKLQEEEESIDLLEIFELLRQHIWIIIASTLVAGVIGFVAVNFFSTPKYRASATIIVNSKENADNYSVEQYNASARLVNMYSVIIKSDTVLDAVGNELNLNYGYQKLQGMVSVSSVDETPIMRITVTSDSAELSRQICDEITKVAPEKIVDAVEAGSVKIISEARANESPVSPHKKRDTAIAALAGMLLSIAVIVLIHFFDNKINTETDVAKYLNMTVLGVIPFYEKEKK